MDPSTPRKMPGNGGGSFNTPPMTPVSQARKDLALEVAGNFNLYDRRTAELLDFPFKTTDYVLDKKSLLGSGLWSDVYLALPTLPDLLPTQPDVNTVATEVLTPPLTPVKPRNAVPSIPSIPRAYAIKVPASTSAKAVIVSEARVLSHLSSFPEYDDHVVPFFGLDPRNGVLVMGALPTALDKLVTKDLNSLDSRSRIAHLAGVFPRLAWNLVRGLEWLNEHKVIHADIKPANILLSEDGTPVFADFSSSILAIPSDKSETKLAAPMGGGTWDFLCPSILTRDSVTSQYPSPSTSTDLYSLAVTLLCVVIGHSPFDSAGSNIFRRRDMVKMGTPIAFAFGGDNGAAAEQRCSELSTALGWNVVTWLEGGLRKADRRVGVQEWRESLERLVR